jgi:hypothetical protein
MGQYLTGTITFAKDELGKKACSYPVRYILPEPSKNASSSSKNNNHSENTSKESKDTTGTNAAAPCGNNASNLVSEPSTSSTSTATATKDKDSKEKSKMKKDDYNEALLDFKISTLEKLGKNFCRGL